MAWGIGNRLRGFLLPDDLAALDIHGVDRPAVLVFRRRTFATKVQALLRLFSITAVDDGGEINAIAPNDRRRPAHSGNVRLPEDIVRSAPLIGEFRIFDVRN